MKFLSLLLVILLTSTAISTAAPIVLIRGNDNHKTGESTAEQQRRRRMQSLCGSISEEALAAFQLTEQDCFMMAGGDSSNRDDSDLEERSCEVFDHGDPCAGGCEPDQDCIIVPAGGANIHSTMCSTMADCAADFNVTELSCHVVCTDGN